MFFNLIVSPDEAVLSFPASYLRDIIKHLEYPVKKTHPSLLGVKPSRDMNYFNGAIIGRDSLIGLNFVIWKSQEFLQAPDMID